MTGRTNFRALIAALCAFGLGVTAVAQPRVPDLAGWWRADIEYRGERTPVYLELRGGDHPSARVTIPLVRSDGLQAGPYQTSGSSLVLPAHGWQMTIGEGGRSLDGLLPRLFAPQELRAHFVRSEAPTIPPLRPAAQPPAPAWRVSVGAAVWAGLVLDPRSGLLFVAADDGRVSALSARDGRSAWSAALGAPIRATPTLAGARLYVATDTTLFALNATNGARIWSAPLGAPLSPRLPMSDPHAIGDDYSSSAAVGGRLVVIGGRDGCVHAFETASGAQSWQTCTGRLVTSTPAIIGGSVYFGGFDGRAYALSLADGAERWRYDSHAPIPRDAVAVGRNVLFGSRSYELLALDQASGRVAWSRYFWFSWVDSVPVLRDGIIYVGSSDALSIRAIDPASGHVIWSSPVPGWSWARVAVGRTSVYAGIVGGEYFAARSAALAAIDRRTGALRWMITQPAAPDHGLSGFASAPAIGGRRLFAADLTGTIYAFDEP